MKIKPIHDKQIAEFNFKALNLILLVEKYEKRGLASSDKCVPLLFIC